MADCLAQITADVLPLEQCARALGLDGLALLLSHTEGMVPEPVQIHGRLTGLLEDVQLVHGQGPSDDAVRYGRRVLVPDLAALPPGPWPGLVTSIQQLGVSAVFAFPLLQGGMTIGALTGHRVTAGPMSRRQLTDARALAEGAVRAASRQPHWLTESPLPFAAAHQAAGALAQRHGLSPGHAWLLLRSQALAHDQTLLETAHAVLRSRFT
ncbi:GAF domain-containing protein [Streptomyces sp. NPDC042319]|uniref:GAF domain-containing protein n=1 Tax=Streptomyces sp. NPDC042319 TaxID=3154332 RepID=UPI0033C0D063